MLSEAGVNESLWRWTNYVEGLFVRLWCSEKPAYDIPFEAQQANSCMENVGLGRGNMSDAIQSNISASFVFSARNIMAHVEYCNEID